MQGVTLKTKNNGGINSRNGTKFHEEIEKIKDERLLNGKSRERLSTEKITNLIVRHTEYWKPIFIDIIELDEEEIDRLCR